MLPCQMNQFTGINDFVYSLTMYVTKGLHNLHNSNIRLLYAPTL